MKSVQHWVLDKVDAQNLAHNPEQNSPVEVTERFDFQNLISQRVLINMAVVVVE